ncbi:MAG TPA: sigma-70 family RNA polymerase sigma factor [Polyangiaceae bacterium]
MPTHSEGGANAPRTDETVRAAPRAAQTLGFREIHDTHYAFVWRYAANHRVPKMAIDDVVQEVFVIVHHRLSSFEGRSSLKTWLAGIAHNVVRAYFRKPGNRLAENTPIDELQLLAPGANPAEALERKVALELLHQLLDKLSDAQREVFILCEIEQLSSVEVAEALGTNESTVRTRLFAARKLFNTGAARARAAQKWRKP